MAVDQFASCNLALVPAHAVVTRPETRDKVVSILQAQQVSKDLLEVFLYFLDIYRVIYICTASYFFGASKIVLIIMSCCITMGDSTVKSLLLTKQKNT